MQEKEIKKLIKPESQDRNVFNAFKRFMGVIDQLDNKQLAMVNFECWHEARMRGGVQAVNELEK